MKTIRILSVIAVFFIAISASADSLWQKNSKGMFADSKARKVGDIVTILIAESMSTSQKAASDFTKDLKHDNAAGVGPILKILPEIAVDSSQSGSAEGSRMRTSSLVAKITAQVIEVLPNGNLRIEGKSVLDIDTEKQELTITGTVRSQDISPENTVLSTYLADIQIKCSGKGAIADRQKEGLISKLIKFLF